jgi:uncharacterized protein YjbI with pentapeptide repeats
MVIVMQHNAQKNGKWGDGPVDAKYQNSICLTPREKILLTMTINSKGLELNQPHNLMYKPENLPAGWIYENIKDAIYHCRRIYYIYLAILCYTLLTILTTPTLAFFREQIIQMPIMDARMPLNYYLIIAPLLLIGFFIYKQLYLYKTNRLIKYAIDECKAINKNNCKACSGLTNQCTLNSICNHHLSRLYPWIIIYCRFIEGKQRTDAEKDTLGVWISKFQKTFVNFSLWGLLPLILILLSIFVVKKHSLGLSAYMIAVTCLGLAVVAFFWYHQQRLIEQKQSVSFLFSFITIIASISAVVMLIWLNVAALNLKMLWFEKPWDDSIAGIDRLIRNVTFADLSYHLISDKPISDKEFWVDLKGSHFEGANLSYTKLKKADLRGSFLQHAVLIQTNLEEANLDGSIATDVDFVNGILNEASFISAKLRDSHFSDAKLRGANFSSSDLEKVDFDSADLTGATFFNSYLYGVNFRNANLQNADLKAAKGIFLEQLSEAENYIIALYNQDWLAKLGLAADHNERVLAKRFYDYDFKGAKLAGADFENADLRVAHFNGAYLQDANFKGADMYGAILDDANLRSAELKGVQNLKVEQFAKVKTLYGARMDSALKKEIERKYPNLLNPPDDFIDTGDVVD